VSSDKAKARTKGAGRSSPPGSEVRRKAGHKGRKAGSERTQVSLSSTKRGILPFGIAIALVGLAGVAAVVLSATMTRGERSGAGETRPVSVVGTPLPKPPADANAPDPAIGMKAPTVSGESFDGSPISIGAPSEKSTVVVFLAHWCPHCQAEVPRIVSWSAAKPLPEGVSVVSVSTGVKRGASNYPPSAWLQRERWPFPVLADDSSSSAGEAFGVAGYPTFILLSREGKVLYRTSGELTMEQWDALLKLASSVPAEGAETNLSSTG
jgi:cytochrome c biogenesis protein CcmG/thiol:disulfide interchange protein DsbE